MGIRGHYLKTRTARSEEHTIASVQIQSLELELFELKRQLDNPNVTSKMSSEEFSKLKRKADKIESEISVLSEKAEVADRPIDVCTDSIDFRIGETDNPYEQDYDEDRSL